MKKILSLLSMLMIAVTAFATDFIGQLDYKVTTKTGFFNGPSYANGTLKIEDYAGGKYTVTATGCDLSSLEMGNWGEIICEGVEATTDANGVTTIDVTPYALRGSDNAELTNAKLFVKFKGDKAYATFKGTYNPNFFTNITVEYTFGVDEGFEGGGSTGGGETGGEEKPAAFEKVNFVGDGTNFDWKIPVNWDTQKIVMSIDPSTCTGNCEDIIGLGEVATAWNNTLHLYRKTDGTLQGYFQIPGGSNNNTNPFDETNPIKVEVSKAQGFVVNGVVKIPASEMSALFALSTVNMGTGEGANDKSRATYNYVKVVDKDWTEPTEPEVTVTFEKQYADQLYSLADGTPSAMGDATVTLKEMSDNTISMSLVFSEMNVESTDLVKGTDEKERITYTGTANFQGTNYAIKALRYTKDEEEKLYMTLTATDGTTLAFGEDPDYVAPPEPEDVTLWENYQADGTGFSKTATINWDKQKIVASIDFSNGGDDKDILAMTTGDSFAAFQTSTYRTMHWYCQQSVKQMSGFFAKDGAGNNNTGRMDVADCLAKFEISKAEGLKVNGEVKMSPAVLDELFASNTILIGSGESPKFSKAFYKYIKVVSLDWTETTEPEVKVEKTFNEAFYMVQGTTSTKVADAKVVVKEMSDETINMSLQYMENEYTSTELTKGTDEKNRTTYTGKVAKDNQTYDVAGVVYEKETADRLYMTMTATGVTFVVGENPDAVTPEAVVYTNTLKVERSNGKSESYEDAKVSVLTKGEGVYEITLPKFSDLDGVPGEIGPVMFQANGVEEDGKVVLTATDQAFKLTNPGWTTSTAYVSMKGEIADGKLKATFNVNIDSYSSYKFTLYYGVEAPKPEVTVKEEKTFTDAFSLNNVSLGSATVTIKEMTDETINMVFTFGANTFESSDIVKGTDDKNRTTYTGHISIGGVEREVNGVVYTKDNAEKLYMTFASTTSGTYVFGTEPTDTPEPPVVEDYAINFDKDAKQTHAERYSTSVSLQQTGKDKQTIEFGKTMNGYEDLTAKKFTVEAGSEVTPSIGYVGEWMHGYVYIDLDNNKQFSFNADGADQTGTDVVSYSYYKDQNSKGEAASNNCNVNPMPSFTAPTTPGTYRIRFKVDWDNIDAGGSVASGNNILNNGGGIYDATLEVVEPVVNGISTINAEVANGEAQLFTVDGVQIAKLQKGLNIVRTADGKVKKVLVK